MLKNNGNNSSYIYFTDGSVFKDSCGAGFYYNSYNNYWQDEIGQNTCHFKLSQGSTILQCELYGIKMALDHFINILSSRHYEKIIICIDSIAAIYNILSIFKRDNISLNMQILELCMCIEATGCSISIIWCPSHINIFGNEMADKAAKFGANCHLVPISLPQSKRQFKASVSTIFSGFWQTRLVIFAFLLLRLLIGIVSDQGCIIFVGIPGSHPTQQKHV